MNTVMQSAAVMRHQDQQANRGPVVDAVRNPGSAGLSEAVCSLLRYCRERDWAGHDPYDALNSRVFAATPLSRSRFCRLALTQTLKRLPINVRPLLRIPATQNPKALGLFLSSLLRLERLGIAGASNDIDRVIERLVQLRSPDTPYWCWGYSFPWQTRIVLVPCHAPNLVCTTFVSHALLDVYEQRGDTRCRDMAESAARYLAQELYWTTGNGEAGFSYPVPGTHARIHNANLLGAALLFRIYSRNKDRGLRDAALAATRYSVSRQEKDGSWYYGEGANQRWIDNFHTGYNLCALRAINSYAGSDEFGPSLRRGYEFFQDRFFREDGAPKYFHDRTYPIDIHSVAQSMITLLTMRDYDKDGMQRAQSLFAWALQHMRDEQGHFYYQSLPLYRNTISYMRWSQAWMLLALSALLEACQQDAAAQSNP